MYDYTFMTNSIINIPRNIASVEIKNKGIEVRSEVVSMAIVIQLRRMVPIITPLKRGVCMSWLHRSLLYNGGYLTYIYS